MKHLVQKLLRASLAAVLALSLAAVPALGARAALPAPERPAIEGPLYPAYNGEEMCERLHGKWTASFHTVLTETTYLNDPVEMNFIDNGRRDRKLLLTIDSFESAYTLPNDWRAGDGVLEFSVNDAPWQAFVAVHFQDDNTLVGSYTQYNRTFEIRFNRVSDVPARKDEQPQFSFEGKSIDVWKERLEKHPKFSSGKPDIPFSYEIHARDKVRPLLQIGRISQVMDGWYQDDAQLMKALMDAVCDEFPHDGASGMPEKKDALSVMDYARGKGGIECRGLATLLSEALRASGIPAKPVMCIPYSDPSEDCHVVVHAWSWDFNQWVMLDPTYRLMLHNRDGGYVSLPMLREALRTGERLIPNADAGHNRTPFSMEYYRAYMTKNCFRFSSLTDSSFGAENDPANKTRMLVPEGWTLPWAWSRPEIVTYNADAFWAAPGA